MYYTIWWCISKLYYGAVTFIGSSRTDTVLLLGGTNDMNQDIEKILITEEEIQNKIKELGKF